MALAIRDYVAADQAFEAALRIMQDFRAEGNFRLRIDAEETKEWKGESFEKMAAFTYAGLALIQLADLDNALAMFKSAAVADAGTVDAQWRGDYLVAYFMQHAILKYLHEPGAPEQVKYAADAIRLRGWMSAAASATKGLSREGDLAAELAMDGLAVGLTQWPDDLHRALEIAAVAAEHRGMRLLATKPKYRDVDYVKLKKPDVRRVPSVLASWRAAILSIPQSTRSDIEAQAGAIEALFERPFDALIVVELGAGPVKVQDGEFGHLLGYAVDERPPENLTVRVNGKPHFVPQLDSLGFQATTRGGRRIESRLKKRATRKGRLEGTGSDLSGAGSDLIRSASDGYTLFAGLLTSWIGKAVSASARNIYPEADARGWRLLPDAFYILPVQLTPGRHEVRVGDRREVLTVRRGEFNVLRIGPYDSPRDASDRWTTSARLSQRDASQMCPWASETVVSASSQAVLIGGTVFETAKECPSGQLRRLLNACQAQGALASFDAWCASDASHHQFASDVARALRE